MSCVTGAPPATRVCFLASAASRFFTRLGWPSPTRTMPGRPTTRCTMSAFLVTATAGVTVQPRRSVCSADAAAPVWPSIWLYAAFSTLRPKTIVTTRNAIATPSGRRISRCPTSTKTARMPRKIPASTSPTLGSDFLVSWYADRICLSLLVFSAGASFLAISTFSPVVSTCCRRGPRLHSLTVQPTGPVRRTHEWPGHDTGEPDLLRLVLQFDELLRPDPPLDRVVPHRRTQVLRDRDDLAAGVVQV